MYKHKHEVGVGQNIKICASRARWHKYEEGEDYQDIDHDTIEQIQELQTPRDNAKICEFRDTIYKPQRDNALQAYIMICRPRRDNIHDVHKLFGASHAFVQKNRVRLTFMVDVRDRA